jgi:hypothetical protein
MLFHPFEEQFNLPAVSVELCNGERRDIEVVREIDVAPVGCLIVVFDTT